MNQLPVEIQEKILKHFLWDKINELYELRVVSKAWKSVIDEFTSRLFQVWYNRCKAEIPEDHLSDIVEAKYPLVGYPWQEYYWVNSRLPHVAKNAYDIWKNLPNFDDGIDATKLEEDWPLGSSSRVAASINAKYYGRTVRDSETGSWITEIYQWNNKAYFRIYKFDSNQIDFYTTNEGTFVVLAQFCDKKRENYISKYPIDNLNLPPKLILFGRGKYCITRNECFHFTEGHSAESGIIKHKILTERGFETSTIIEPPAGMPQLPWNEFRVEIIGCTLYIVKLVGRLRQFDCYHQTEDEKLSISKYKISRNSDGKLSFTFEELNILDRNERENNAVYSRIYNFFPCDIGNDNLSLIDYAFTTKKFNPWLEDAFNGNIKALAVHANYVICQKWKSRKTQICIFQKSNLIECMEANDPDHLKPALRFNFPLKVDINWIGIMYIGLKAQILAQHHEEGLCSIKFY